MEQPGEKRFTFQIAVRALVEFCCRQGDLMMGFRPSISGEEGIRIHKMLQNQRPATYEPEVPVKYTLQHKNIDLVISGRIDGLDADGLYPTIEEIKSTMVVPDAISELTRLLHLAQAKIYAYLFCLEEEKNVCQICMTYYHLPSESESNFYSEHTFEELKEFFEIITSQYLDWLERYVAYLIKRDNSIKQLDFPHNQYRPGQREFAVTVYRTLVKKSQLLAQAPTGIGKTISTLFPAIKAIGEEVHHIIFFLTAKTMGRTVAEQALKTMESDGLQIKSVSLTAKDKMCFCRNGSLTLEDEEVCPYTIGYYNRLLESLGELFQHNTWTRSILQEISQKHQVCPFEFSLELALWADIIIGDYNYVFHPSASLRRFKEQKAKQFSIFVDEAHNLEDRARDMFSAQLAKDDFLALKRAVQSVAPQLAKCLNQINKVFLTLKNDCLAGTDDFEKRSEELYISHECPDFEIEFHYFCAEVEQLAKEGFSTIPDPLLREKILECYFEILQFLRVFELYNDEFITIIKIPSHQRTPSMEVTLFCLDPAGQLKKVYAQTHASVFFSATLHPFDFYSRTIGLKEEHQALDLPSPFPPQNAGIFVARHIKTTYRDRAKSYGTIAELIHLVIQAKKGKYLVCFPSYQYLETVQEQVMALSPDTQIKTQTTGMDETARMAFLNDFLETDSSQALLGFTIMGGLFGEGIDLPGNKLIGVIVVGVGLPQICVERDLIKDYFNEAQQEGFAYAYQLPGMRRVLQSAGRVIRSATDQGVIVLIDERFGHYRYQKLFPSFWKVQMARSNPELENQVKQFWQRIEEE